jgi:hypothetical protein
MTVSITVFGIVVSALLTLFIYVLKRNNDNIDSFKNEVVEKIDTIDDKVDRYETRRREDFNHLNQRIDNIYTSESSISSLRNIMEDIDERRERTRENKGAEG